MKIDILGVKIDKKNFNKILAEVRGFLADNRQHYIVTPNPEFVVAAQKDDEFKWILNAADIAIPDGVGLLFASWFFGRPIWRRITGVDFTWHLCQLAEETDQKIYLLGGLSGVAEKTKAKILKQFPKLKIVGADWGGEFRQLAENTPRIIDDINQKQPDILLVAFGPVIQEKWIAKNLAKMPSVNVAMGVGGTFDYIAGAEKYAPRIIRRLGLEWLYRLFTQPRRARRIFNAFVVFVYLVIKYKAMRIYEYMRMPRI